MKTVFAGIATLLLLTGIAFSRTHTMHADRASNRMTFIKGGSYIPFSVSDKSTKRIYVRSFLLEDHPVTNDEYLAFVTANPQWRRSRVKPIFADKNYLRSWPDDLHFPGAEDGSAPVTYVSWFAARAYCAWAHKRLPTTDEWEFAFKRGKAGTTETVKREWVEDFDSILLGDGSSESGESSPILSCGGAAVSATNPADYQAFLRFSFRASLKANYSLPNLTFRCAEDISNNTEALK